MANNRIFEYSIDGSNIRLVFSGSNIRIKNAASNVFSYCCFPPSSLSRGAVTNRLSSNIEYSIKIKIKIRISGYHIIQKRTALLSNVCSDHDDTAPLMFCDISLSDMIFISSTVQHWYYIKNLPCACMNYPEKLFSLGAFILEEIGIVTSKLQQHFVNLKQFFFFFNFFSEIYFLTRWFKWMYISKNLCCTFPLTHKLPRQQRQLEDFEGFVLFSNNALIRELGLSQQPWDQFCVFYSFILIEQSVHKQILQWPKMLCQYDNILTLLHFYHANTVCFSLPSKGIWSHMAKIPPSIYPHCLLPAFKC